MIRVELVILVAVLAFFMGAIGGAVSVSLYRQWERTLDEDEREWKRLGWVNRLDRRRELKRRFNDDKGKSAW